MIDRQWWWPNMMTNWRIGIYSINAIPMTSILLKYFPVAYWYCVSQWLTLWWQYWYSVSNVGSDVKEGGLVDWWLTIDIGGYYLLLTVLFIIMVLLWLKSGLLLLLTSPALLLCVASNIDLCVKARYVTVTFEWLTYWPIRVAKMTVRALLMMILLRIFIVWRYWRMKMTTITVIAYCIDRQWPDDLQCY